MRAMKERLRPLACLFPLLLLFVFHGCGRSDREEYVVIEGRLLVQTIFGGIGDSGANLSFGGLIIKADDGKQYKARLMPDYEYVDHTGTNPMPSDGSFVVTSGRYRCKGLHGTVTVTELRQKAVEAGHPDSFFPSDEVVSRFDIHVLELLAE